jgi:hypothetical protein
VFCSQSRCGVVASPSRCWCNPKNPPSVSKVSTRCPSVKQFQNFRSCSMKMSSAGFLVLVLVLLVTCSEAEPATEFAEASDGGTASLPCSLAPTHPPDKVTVVLWYRGVQESPIYKYDLRGSRPQHWADASLDNRYFLRVLDDERAVMSISPTKLTDEEIFHCRVDFNKSPTRITHVNLTIVGEFDGSQFIDFIKHSGARIRVAVKNVHFMR